MVLVIKIDGLVSNVKPGEIRRFFKENGVRPEDIHIAYPNGARDGVAFLIFHERRDADNGLKADGSLFLGRRLAVRNSTPKEFNMLFPGIPMISRNTIPPSPVHTPAPSSAQAHVIKINGMENKTSKTEIRNFFKGRGVHIDDIHLVQGNHRDHDHTGLGFMIFMSRREADSALKANGSFLRNNKLFLRISTPGEFNKYFPRVPMLQRGISTDIPKPTLKPSLTTFKGVVKVDNIHFNARPGDVRRHFRDHSATVADIHFILGPNGKHQGTAFVIFTEKQDLDNGLRVDGSYLQGRKITVMPSTPKEFDRYFPKVAMLSDSTPSKEIGMKRAERERDFSSTRRGERSTRDRSRSPIRNDRNDGRDAAAYRGSNYGRAGATTTTTTTDPLAGVDQDKFIRMSGLPYDVGMTQIVNFFQPIQIKEIFILKHADGKYSGETTGSAVVEFFAKPTARKALQEFDGRTMSQRLIGLRYASKEDISRALNFPMPTDAVAQVFSSVSDLQNAGAGSTPQVQNLLALLTATVSAMAGQQQGNEPVRRGDRSDTVITRVASSANVDVTDIKRGCVIGMRNLPYSVTPDDILKFFHGFHVIADSVRIHYLDDGRCSGDAIISFRDNRDARNAVSALNRKNIGRRRVELFFL